MEEPDLTASKAIPSYKKMQKIQKIKDPFFVKFDNWGGEKLGNLRWPPTEEWPSPLVIQKLPPHQPANDRP